MPTERKVSGYELTSKLRKTRRRIPLTATEQALFYELVAICNEVEWDEVFGCSNDELCLALRISENTLNAARLALINAGLIFYVSGKSRRQYGSYSFTKELSRPKPTVAAAPSKFEVVGQNQGAEPGSTVSKFEVDAATVPGGDAGVDPATDPQDYIQTVTKRETKPNYASSEALARGRPELFDEPAEERKKGCAEKKKEDRPEVTPHWTAMRDLWVEFYSKRHNGIAPTFGAEAGRGMKSILKRLQAHTSASDDVPWTQDRAAQVFTHFLTLAYSDAWLSRHFRISNLSSHYDTIIQTNAPDQEGRPNKAGRKSAPTDVRGAARSTVSPWIAGKEIVLFRPLHQAGSRGAALADLSEAYSKSFKSLMIKAETSLIEAVRMDTPNFGMLNTGRGNLDVSKSTISVLLLNLLDYFTAEWNLTQLEDCSEIIATDFYWLSQAEFKIFTLRCKKGHFGTDYGKLSPQRLLLWLEDFSQECRYERAGVNSHGVVECNTYTEDDWLANPQISVVLRQLKERLIFDQIVIDEQEARTLDGRIKAAQGKIQHRWDALRFRQDTLAECQQI